MKTRIATLPILFLLVLALLVPGEARAGKLYVGASAGQTSADVGLSDLDDGSITSGSVDDSDTGYKAFVGYRLTRRLALEADWIDLGEVSADAVSDGSGPSYVAGPVTSTATAEGYRLSALAIVPVGKRFSILARYGYFSWESSTPVTNGGVTFPDDDSDEESFYGVGVVVMFKGPFSLRVEHEKMTLDQTDVDLTSAGVAFRF